MKDWAVRALKTFVQAFFGVYIPAGEPLGCVGAAGAGRGGGSLRCDQRGLESRTRAGGGGTQWIIPFSSPC